MPSVISPFAGGRKHMGKSSIAWFFFKYWLSIYSIYLFDLFDFSPGWLIPFWFCLFICLFVFSKKLQPTTTSNLLWCYWMLLKRGPGSGERGTGNGSLGTSCQRKPPKKSKMAVQKTRERKEEYKERNSIVPWLKSDGDEIANQTHILRLRFEQVVCFFDIQPVSFTIW